MTTFALRIELNGYPSAEVYEQLHRALAAWRFERRILGDDGKFYALPKATYVGTASTDAVGDINEHFRPIVGALWGDYELIVFRFDQASWYLTQQV